MARIKKIKIKGFTIIDNDVINDDRMHLKALGLFAYMWSKPDDWQFYVSEIASHFKDGESAVSSAMKELMTLGYLKRTQNRKDGRFSNYDYVLRELPKRENQGSAPKGDFPKPEKPNPENRGLLNTDHTNTDHTNKDDDDQPVEDAFNLAQLAGINVNSGLNLPVFTDYINRLGNDLVCYAIKRTNELASHPNWSYLKTVLKSLEDNHVKTVEQAEKLSKKYGQSRRGKSSPKKAGKKQQYHFETCKAPDGMSQTEAIAKELAEAEAEDREKEAKRDDG
ncbi:DnaD domain protein [Limosilactobacillus vaginalis]|uniref:DnaD domain protein n=1 Tax=Limosilactobacillus vaginalis TaxID=1633 RepID=UPI0025A4B1E2|nr:DnaD domain protein [Limosilactobacillus vaginalis]MDM8221957.1 DnaD domain protein [Limosilactobacillus vaginalis]